MTQGRNIVLQERIDDILHIICQKDFIDSELFEKYLHCLEEGWIEGGARNKVLQLLRSRDGRLQSVAIQVLTKLATEADLECLEDFVADPTVHDISKLSLATILKALDSEMADDGLLEYLNDPAGAIRQMQSHLLDLVGKSMLGTEVILNDFSVMPEEQQWGFLIWLGNSGDPRAANVLIPLLDLTSSKLVQAVIEAMERLGPLAVSQTVPALKSFIGFAQNRQLKDLARGTIQRLASQAFLVANEFESVGREFRHRVHDTRVSPLDSAGNQLVMFSWCRPDGKIQGVNLLTTVGYGVRDCYSIDEVSAEQWQLLIQNFREHGYDSLSVPFDYARALATEAYSQNGRAHSYLPLAYSLWRCRIEGNGSREKKKKLIVALVAVASQDVDDSVLSSAAEGGKLLELPEFSAWYYTPLERIAPYIARYTELLPSNYNVMQSASFSLTDKQKILLDQLVFEALNELIDQEWRQTHEMLLRRQAALFQQTGREQMAQMIQGVAAALDPQSSVPLEQQLFPQALLRLSIQYGPLHLMLERLRMKKPVRPFMGEEKL
jgi:hypothetical protein